MSVEELLSVVNASGFLFQLRLEAESRDSADEHGWEILTLEHPWSSPETGESGFIDLVLQYGAVRLVVECKRPRQGKWIFLVPETQQQPRALNRLLWTHREEKKKDLLGFHEFGIQPKSLWSSFCVVRGKGETDQPMLERLAHGLLRATKALSLQELALAPRHGPLAGLAIYVPVVVTSAELYTCRFPVNQVSLVDGMLDEAAFESVPYVRFEKSLLLDNLGSDHSQDLRRLYEQAVATVFVVNAASFASFLKTCNLAGSPTSHQNPWNRLRALEA